jgi:multimeric flavodoxin WrbA
MKVLMLNGSPKANGNTATALNVMAETFREEGVEVEIVHVGNQPIRGCIACGKCYSQGKCVFDDLVNEVIPKLEEADGLVLGSPVYYASANATLMAFVQRLFYCSRVNKTMKVGASVVVARRGGLSATYDELNKFFGISGMPIASGQYWNSLHGAAPGQAAEDAEGIQGMRTLARNMTFLMKSIALGKETYGLPVKEKTVFTNFIR